MAEGVAGFAFARLHCWAIAIIQAAKIAADFGESGFFSATSRWFSSPWNSAWEGNRPGGITACAVGALATLGACDSGPAERPIPDVAFCQEVLPRVEAFMAQAREQHPTPDDPRYGGTAVLAGSGELSDGMNAAVSTDSYATQHQQFVNLMPLIDYDENLEPRGLSLIHI